MICVDAFKNLNIVTQGNDLSISPCCYSPTKPVSLIDFQNDTYLNDIRHLWLAGKFPKECNGCEQKEKNKQTSRRIGSNQWYADHACHNNHVELMRLDYWTGDLCNLRCAICSPHNSSAWKEELNFPAKTLSVNRFWRQLNLSKLKFVHFNGGEPLLSKEHVDFLKEPPNKNQVHINYNTNGTVLPSAELLSLWQQFKIVQLDFSIDDIEERFEYQRYPANWSTITKNLQWYIDNSPTNCMFAVNTTISILNYANLENLQSWLKNNFSSNRLTDPVEHRQQFAHGTFALDHGALTDIAKKFLDDCDNRRGTNWRKTFPELN
jgi:sulfatase maturation enzyme AslB (radical SAM superfamily)